MKKAITVAGLGVALGLLFMSSPADARYCSLQVYDCTTDGMFYLAKNHATYADAVNFIAPEMLTCTPLDLMDPPELGCAEVLLDSGIMYDLYCTPDMRTSGDTDRCGSNFEIGAIDLADICAAYDLVLYNAWDNWSYQLKTVAGACP